MLIALPLGLKQTAKSIDRLFIMSGGSNNLLSIAPDVAIVTFAIHFWMMHLLKQPYEGKCQLGLLSLFLI
ncbi:hypothetical protein WA1_20125 [Scytonema hofmannii PCC 7110]|uniref:Uncharacterized protein n=1 Tax=Scytonema hofmannii PCC 7110 TaxID=128403 RepID=A0A139XC92_9CYAN|nr:hypothetical protein WA1_20125 [Scytonema hofmannii PCC 7110]